MRLPLLATTDLTAEQQPLYRLFEQMAATDEFTGMTVRQADGAFLGPFGVMLHFPAAGTALAEYARATSALLAPLPPSARQVLILTVGGRLNAAYELDAHTVAARRAGLRDEQIATLCAGVRPADLSAEENLAADVASALLRGPLPKSTYRAVVDTLGQNAFDAMVLLTAQYLAICALLNAYDVPVPEEES
jgi:4-carboxymuconolactone decarboxylase